MTFHNPKKLLLGAIAALFLSLSCASYVAVPKDALPENPVISIVTKTPDTYRLGNDQGVISLLAFETLYRGPVESTLKELDPIDFRSMIQSTVEEEARIKIRDAVFTTKPEESNLELQCILQTWDFNAGPENYDKHMEDLNFAHVSLQVRLNLFNKKEGKIVWTTVFTTKESIWNFEALKQQGPKYFWGLALRKGLAKPFKFLNESMYGTAQQ